MIEIKDLHYNYAGSKYNVFDGLSVELDNNSIYGLLGRNGTGKSTLLYLIAGLLKPKSGSVFTNGMEARKRHPEMLRELYMVPEEFELPSISLESFIKIHEDFYPYCSRETLERCLSDFQVQGIRSLRNISMGQKKKVFMSFALASGCELLLMDEPTNGLDIPSKALFRKIVAGNIPEGSTLVISTHQVHDVEQLLDHIIILDNCNLLINASTDEIVGRYEFGYRMPDQMDNNILYAEPSLQGNAVVALRQKDSPETPINVELLFNAAILGKLK